MMTFRIVADSSCLIGLAQIELFGLLKDLFSETYIPRAVYEEVVVKGRGEAGSGETEFALKDGWISMKDVNDKTAVNALRTILGKGESEVIILCKELKAAPEVEEYKRKTTPKTTQENLESHAPEHSVNSQALTLYESSFDRWFRTLFPPRQKALTTLLPKIFYTKEKPINFLVQ